MPYVAQRIRSGAPFAVEISPMRPTVPPLFERVFPLLVLGWTLGAVRLGLDAVAPDWPPTMYVGLYYVMPLGLLWVGLTGRWGPIGWWRMAGSMAAIGFLVWGVCNAIAYTTGQFMEWEHGRFDPGELKVDAAGNEERVGARAAPVFDDPLWKIGAGLLHGVLSSLVSTVWCTAIGTLVVWLPARLRHHGGAT